MNLSFSPGIDIIIGCMYSGKTTETIRRLTIYHQLNMKVLYINSQIDTRSDKAFSTHNETIGQIPFPAIKLNSLTDADVTDYQVIAVDEGQFFTDLATTVLNWVDKKNKIVIVAGLSGDFRRQPFGQIAQLLPHCDSITKLNSFCLDCRRNRQVIKPAHFTKRITAQQNEIVVGGQETYIPVCRDCFNR